MRSIIKFYSTVRILLPHVRYLKTHLSVAHPDQAELESMRTELHFARRQAEMLK